MRSTPRRRGSAVHRQKRPTVPYSLAAVAAPVAVADYYGLPADARAALPSAEEFQP